jgi:hypothetical protein
MDDDEAALRRVRFLGLHDMATGLYLDRVAELVERFDPSNVPTNAVDILELHNVQRYIENNCLPQSYSEAELARAKSLVPQLHRTVARFFASIDDTQCASLISEIDHGYHAELLDLLGRGKAFERCAPEVMLQVLHREGVHVGEMLANQKLVAAYDHEIRLELLASPRKAELWIRHYMDRNAAETAHFPASLTPDDVRQWLETYIDSDDANINYIGLIGTAKTYPLIGRDPKLKLRARRRKTAMTHQFFEENSGFKTGSDVRISETQVEEVRYEMDDSDGRVARFTYSSSWLEQTCDQASILNNFQHLFGFADAQVLLTLPSYPSQLSVVERFMGATGKTDYKVGVAFRAIDMSTLLQTRLYHQYLTTKDIDLEAVIAWFFGEYLIEEFNVLSFSFIPSDALSPYLQKVRHLFAEMESVVNQFKLFVENGEIDRELLAISSDPVGYKHVPSLVTGKYLYPNAESDISGILHALFSDQSGLTYINEGLRADDAAGLLIHNQIAYTDFLEYQKSAIDHLIKLDILVDTGTRVRFTDVEQFRILKSLFTTGAVSYYHLSEAARGEADAMVARGWVTRSASLLTEAEGSYFNYFLNGVEFGNGPELRNKYLHGAQANGEGEDTHFQTYITALRLTVALVIKMNDDFCLASVQECFSPPRSA